MRPLFLQSYPKFKVIWAIFGRLRRAEVRILAQKHVTETPGPRGYGNSRVIHRKSRVIHVSRNSPQITFHVTRESRLAQAHRGLPRWADRRRGREVGASCGSPGLAPRGPV